MSADVLKASMRIIIAYELSRLGSELQQLLPRLPCWPEGHISVMVGGRVIIGVQKMYK